MFQVGNGFRLPCRTEETIDNKGMAASFSASVVFLASSKDELDVFARLQLGVQMLLRNLPSWHADNDAEI